MAQFEILTACRFYVELTLDGSTEGVDGIFLDCKGFKRNQQIIEAVEVTPQKWGVATRGQVVRTKLPGNVKSTNLTLRRGLTCSMTLWKWFDEVEKGHWGAQRRSGSLILYDQASKSQAHYNFRDAWPTGYTLTDLSASSTELEIEELELAVEDFVRVQ
ncbi:phage tail protein [Anthocerotibacter panamensis]|uniref:phage tail protein n=1 Tax=Anthocerotibacter panamensis TaxID=2857077 RepID=UPI001C401FD9|nr:phage tail protein [Anthocerotibacter panamensis]